MYIFFGFFSSSLISPIPVCFYSVLLLLVFNICFLRKEQERVGVCVGREGREAGGRIPDQNI